MGFSDALAASATVKGPGCSVGTALRALDEPIRVEVAAAIADENVAAAVIARALRTYSVFVGGGTIMRHRRGECRCDIR